MEKDNKINLLEIDELKTIYYEILIGSSPVLDESLFIKHFSERESYLIQKRKNKTYQFYKSQNIPEESEALKSAIQNEEWSQEKEDKILELKYIISDNERNIQNIIIEQRSIIQKAIDKNKKELLELKIERKKSLGKSIEDLVDEDINDYISYISFYKDEKCKVPAFDSFEEFEKIDFEEAFKLSKYLNSNYERTNDLSIKKIAAMPFFLNKFSYAKENISLFLGIPLYDLTYNQSQLFSIASRNLSVLTNVDGDPPDLSLGAQPINLVNWYEIQHSILISKRKQSK